MSGGEATVMRSTMVAGTTTEDYHQQHSSTMTASSAWPERFQDLAYWCCPPHQDELNTPKTLQDEFNFSMDDGQSREDIASPLGRELWDTSDLYSTTSVSPESMFCLPRVVSSRTDEKEKSRGEESCFKSQKDHKKLLSLLKTEEPHLGGRNTTKLNSSPFPSIKTETFDELTHPPTYVGRIEDDEEEGTDLFKVPQMTLNEANNNTPVKKEKKVRPILKLNITAASTPLLGTNTTAAASGSSLVSLDTPDVMQSFTDESTGFDLLSFVNGEFDDPNLLTTDPSSLVTPGLDAVKTDHDYTGKRIYEEEEMVAEVKIEPDEYKPVPVEVEEATGSKRRRRKSSLYSPQEEDDEEEEFPVEDEQGSEDSLDWSPYKRKNTSSSSKSSGKRRGNGIRSRGGVKKTARKVSTDYEEGAGQPDRYRELRDRNNEASRKSRLNRKQKEMEMVRLAEQLEKDNVMLKQRAETLERLVKKLREVLMNIVLRK